MSKASTKRKPLATVTNVVTNQPQQGQNPAPPKAAKIKPKKLVFVVGDPKVDAAKVDPQLWAKRVEKLKKIPLEESASMEAYKDDWHMYRDQHGYNWHVVLTQTDIKKRYNNFITMYLLEKDDSALFGVWVRTGRVGSKGRVGFTDYQVNLGEAKLSFEKKFRQKSKQRWSDRANFNSIVGQYNIIENDYTVKLAVSVKVEFDYRMLDGCVLDDRLIDLLLKSFKIVGMQDEELHLSRFEKEGHSFGVLSDSHILRGFRALQKIDGLIADPNLSSRDPALVLANNEFYSAIPHKLQRKADLIRDAVTIRKKVQLLQILGDVGAAVDTYGTLPSSYAGGLLTLYESLKCEIELMDPGNAEYQVIEDYLMNSHCRSHYFRLEIVDLFSCRNEDQIQKFVDHGNKKLLWFGRPFSDWEKILKDGRKTERKQPIGGFIFTDRSTRAANFCLSNYKEEVEVLLGLYEVSLGNCYTTGHLSEVRYKIYAQDFIKDYQSQMGVGVHRPKKLDTPITVLNNVDVPMGVTVLNRGSRPGSESKFNKYFVQNENQFILRYLVRVKVLFEDD